MSDNKIKIGPIAFLVDGDNASANYVGDMLDEVSKYGPVIIRRVYGNWEASEMKTWKRKLQQHALIPSQQFPNRGKKNVTDFKLVIDAMDILHDGVVKGFCIVSSDSDYTSLAMRIREQGLYVIGIGEEKTQIQLDSVDKGHMEEIKLLADALLNGTPEPNDIESAMRAALLTFKTVESIRTHQVQSIAREEYAV